MTNPENLLYSKEHTWVTASPKGEVVTVGITEFAADSLGDVVDVQLPEVGSAVTAGDICGEVESTKSVSDLYSPVSGEVVETNAAVVEDTALINSSPFEQGWLFKVRLSQAPGDLLDAQQYTAHTGG